MKNRYISLLIISGIALIGCAHQIEDVINPMDKDIVFKASWEESSSSTTKTVLQEDGTSVWWSTEEKINVFYGNTRSGVFTSTNTSSSAEASFAGTLALKDGVTEENSSANYWAVYPYNETNSCDGESVTLTIPANQTATEGTFADNFFPAVAKSKNSKLSFYNVCGGVRFSVYNGGITSVSIKTNGEESLVGSVQVAFNDDGKPYVKNVTNGGDQVTVSAPEGGFIPGKYYFAAILPQALSSGLKLTYVNSEAKQASFSLDKSITVNRSRFGVLDQRDKDLTFEGVRIIEFADENVKAKLVAAFDTDGDGELSYAEAAAVKTGEELKTAFGNKGSVIKSFDEFQFFTGIESLVNNQFYGWSALESITLPPGLVSIGAHSFELCSHLTSVVIPEGVTDIRSNAFDSCVRLESISVPDSVTSISGTAFYGCKSLKTFVSPLSSEDGRCLILNNVLVGFARKDIEEYSIPDGVTSIGPHVFHYCSELSKIIIPGRVEMIRESAFSWCRKLTEVVISEGVTTIYQNAFYFCTALTEIELPESVSRIGENAFAGCEDLKAFKIHAFTPPSLGGASVSMLFSNVDDDFRIYVPYESLYIYKNEQLWWEYADRYLPLPGTYNDKYVDLGLSVKWATCNLGASRPEKWGEHYAWGEIERSSGSPYDVDPNGYKYNPSSDYTTFTKYTGDDFDTLQPEDDAAHIILGGKWRIPTKSEWDELMNKENCDWVWGSMNGQDGYYVTSRINGNSIFLPNRGIKIQYGYLPTAFYWSSTLYLDKPSLAYYFAFADYYLHIASAYVLISEDSRYYCFSIRPVTE